MFYVQPEMQQKEGSTARSWESGPPGKGGKGAGGGTPASTIHED